MADVIIGAMVFSTHVAGSEMSNEDIEMCVYAQTHMRHALRVDDIIGGFEYAEKCPNKGYRNTVFMPMITSSAMKLGQCDNAKKAVALIPLEIRATYEIPVKEACP